MIGVGIMFCSNIYSISMTNNNSENNNSDFDQIDFAKMSLQDLKSSIRTKKSRRRPIDDINWSQNKNLFKEL